jgi:hypothetical protein
MMELYLICIGLFLIGIMIGRNTMRNHVHMLEDECRAMRDQLSRK